MPNDISTTDESEGGSAINGREEIAGTAILREGRNVMPTPIT